MNQFFCSSINRVMSEEGCERRRSIGACLCRTERDKEISQGGSGKAEYKAELDAIISSCIRSGMDYAAISELTGTTKSHVGTRVYRMRKMGKLEAVAI